MTHPYDDLGPEGFWRSAVADVGPHGLEGLWQPKFNILPEDRIVTAGSCFAQHFSRALTARGYGWLDAEPAPPFLTEDDRRRFNYGIFSTRTGNIYTCRMLRQWLDLAFGAADEPDEIWEDEGRFFDPLRPVIEPDGFASADEVRAARAATFAALREAVRTADVFVFTLGLTESWVNAETGLEYALCPGTVRGTTFDPARHVFRNPSVQPIFRDLRAAIKRMQAENPKIRVLLTVSPVPLTATASGQHVLTATSHSKAVLRAVAGQMVGRSAAVDYFPSYEIITHPVFRGMFYAPNMRSVEPAGVETVMRHFFADLARTYGAPKPACTFQTSRQTVAEVEDDLVCEEELLNAFAD